MLPLSSSGLLWCSLRPPQGSHHCPEATSASLLVLHKYCELPGTVAYVQLCPSTQHTPAGTHQVVSYSGQ